MYQTKLNRLLMIGKDAIKKERKKGKKIRKTKNLNEIKEYNQKQEKNRLCGIKKS